MMSTPGLIVGTLTVWGLTVGAFAGAWEWVAVTAATLFLLGISEICCAIREGKK